MFKAIDNLGIQGGKRCVEIFQATGGYLVWTKMDRPLLESLPIRIDSISFGQSIASRELIGQGRDHVNYGIIRKAQV